MIIWPHGMHRILHTLIHFAHDYMKIQMPNYSEAYNINSYAYILDKISPGVEQNQQCPNYKHW